MFVFFRRLIIDLYNEIPEKVFEGLISIFCLVGVFIICVYGFKKGWRKVSGLLLIEYFFLTLCSTVLVRSYSEKLGFNFTPLWSYMEIAKDGRIDLIADNVMNVLVFVLFGLFVGMTFAQIKWWQVLLFGCGISVLIETLQFALKRGFAETDDVMHNTLGCLIGYGLYTLVKYAYDKLAKKNLAVL